MVLEPAGAEILVGDPGVEAAGVAPHHVAVGLLAVEKIGAKPESGMATEARSHGEDPFMGFPPRGATQEDFSAPPRLIIFILQSSTAFQAPGAGTAPSEKSVGNFTFSGAES